MAMDQLPYDLKKLSVKDLRQLIVNFERKGKSAWIPAVVKELEERGKATQTDYRFFPWNPVSVAESLAPFKAVAETVKQNQRTNFTTAGGGKFKAKGEPGHCWIDSYSAVKTPNVNIVMGCHVREPGDDPVFFLEVDRQIVETFNADGLAEALEKFRRYADRA